MRSLLTDPQLKILADIGIAVGQLSAASMAVPFVVPGLDKTKLHLIALGLLVTLSSWLLSVLVVRKVKL